MTVTGKTITDDQIIDIRDSLIIKSDNEALSVLELNLLRDCDITLGLVRCKPETRDEARSRVVATSLALARGAK